ncbi:MAG: hypothetical protein ABIJ09_22755 [Pseudomonadota bacterium]
MRTPLAVLLTFALAGAMGFGFGSGCEACAPPDEPEPPVYACSTPADCPVTAYGECWEALCQEHECRYQVRQSGVECSEGVDAGLCYLGNCRDDLCFIDIGSATAQAFLAGAANPDSTCEVCAPAASRTGWTTVLCSDNTSNSCLAQAGTCAPGSTTGCVGAECCVHEPIWDGTGQAPSCNLGTSGATGTCNTAGSCVGCSDAADCDDGTQCRSWTCGVDEICSTSVLADGSTCDFSASDDGECQDGLCLKSCVRSDQCLALQYCDPGEGVCLNVLPNGSPCAIADACRSGFCEQTVAGDSVTHRCAVQDCDPCIGTEVLGACFGALPDNSTTDDCSGACTGAYTAAGQQVCCGGECLCTATGTCM